MTVWVIGLWMFRTICHEHITQLIRNISNRIRELKNNWTWWISLSVYVGLHMAALFVTVIRKRAFQLSVLFSPVPCACHLKLLLPFSWTRGTKSSRKVCLLTPLGILKRTPHKAPTAWDVGLWEGKGVVPGTVPMRHPNRKRAEYCFESTVSEKRPL